MSAELGVVFPGAHVRGGVERVALQVLTHFGRRRPTEFVGEDLPDPPPQVHFRQVLPRPGPAASRPLRFRAVASAALAEDRPSTVLSLGANCPPGDVYWVQSVHRAWLESGSQVRVRGRAVPGAARRLLARHRVLLHMERQYFTEHRPRAVLCTSAREVADLRRLYGVPADVLHVVPNGYDASRFCVRDRIALRTRMRGQLGMGDDDVSVLFVANELHRKGLAVLLDAVALVGDSRIRIDLVGRASPDDYRGQIRRLGLAGRVHWHGPTSVVEQWMAAGDLLVLPTQYEPFGLVIVEALACGLPVITTRRAGASSAVIPGTGLLQDDPADAHELAGLLTQALEPGQLVRWSEAAPAAAVPYEWGAVLTRAEPLLFRPGTNSEAAVLEG